MSDLQRYTPNERGNHWIVVLCFMLAACSGLALFHPSLYFLAAVLGGGPWSRILHPFVGVVMLLFFLFLMIRFWQHNRITENDRRWMQRVRDVIMNRDEGLPEAGKYNAAQKWLFWIVVACLSLLLLSGLVMWRPYLAAEFPIDAIRVAVLVHAVSAFVLITGIIVHIYAAIWVRGSLNAMIRGTVTEAWAKAHHRAWYREMTGK